MYSGQYVCQHNMSHNYEVIWGNNAMETLLERKIKEQIHILHIEHHLRPKVNTSIMFVLLNFLIARNLIIT